MKTFTDFLRSGACKWQMGEDMYRRLIAADIKSRTALLRWIRDRYPGLLRSYTVLAPGSGRERAEQLWADYLQWQEEQEEESRASDRY